MSGEYEGDGEIVATGIYEGLGYDVLYINLLFVIRLSRAEVECC